MKQLSITKLVDKVTSRTINKTRKGNNNSMKLNTTKQYKLAVTTLATLLLGAVAYGLVSPTVEEASAETNISIGTSGYSLSVSSSTSGNNNISVNPTAGGTFTMVKETLNTKTNADGFSMYIGMMGDSNNLYLNGDTSSTALPATNVGSASYTNPNTISTNSWGYAIPQSSTMPIDGGTLINNDLAQNNGFNTGSYIDNSDSESSTKWAPVPVKGSEQIVQNTNSANNTTGVDLNVFYATKVNSSQSAGIYKGTVVYTAVAKSNNALIASSAPSTTMNLGGGDTITVTIGTTATYSSITTKTITITNDPASATSTDQCAITGGGNNPDGSLYLTCTLPAKKQFGRYDIHVDLGNYGTYAIADGIEYIYKETKPIFKITTMQEMTPDVCNDTTTPLASATNLDTDGSHAGDTSYVPSTTLTDERDQQQYTVRKLADGNCWMTENLRYGSTTANAARAYQSSDEALSDNINTTNMGLLTTTYISNVANCGSYFTPSKYAQPSICIYQANTAATYDGKTKYGVLYNYCAATGGTACTASGTTPTVSGSVCPKGWTLPSYNQPTSYNVDDKTTDGSRKDYMNLRNNYSIAASSAGFNILVASPLSFVRAGFADNGSLGYRSSSGYGYYWSSTVAGGNYAYSLNFRSSNVYRSNNNRYYGYSLRCVAS